MLYLLFDYFSIKYFPGREPLRRYLRKLQEFVASKEEDYKSIAGDRWLASLKQLHSDDDASTFLPVPYSHKSDETSSGSAKESMWTGCRGSVRHLRGYTCGVWQMFHLLTVHQWLHPTGIKERSKRSAIAQRAEPAAGSATGTADSPEEAQRVLRAMKAFVTQFFGCRDCAKNFQKECHDMEGHVLTRMGSVLWLWSTHNSVNKRLAGSITEDPSFPKIQFPSKGECLNSYTLTQSIVLN